LAAALMAAVTAAVTGCGGDNGSADGGGSGPKDMTVLHDMASVCGHPGDTGNSVGVGKYCTKITDCSSNTKATLCTTLGSDNAYFCTMTCTAAGAMGECGENASCTCSGGQCGCFPDSCK
jgi:hypothetical protein